MPSADRYHDEASVVASIAAALTSIYGADNHADVSGQRLLRYNYDLVVIVFGTDSQDAYPLTLLQLDRTIFQ